jgi:hypothetical protein
VDFWGTGPKPKTGANKLKEDAGSDLFTDVTLADDGRVQVYRPPHAVLDLLQSPTQENAQKYVAWQRDRLSKIAAAVKAVRDASAKAPDGVIPVKVTYLKRAGCPACQKQDVEIKKITGQVANVIEIDSPELLEALGVEAVPAFIITDPVSGRRKSLSGFQTAESILATARELAGGKDEHR